MLNSPAESISIHTPDAVLHLYGMANGMFMTTAILLALVALSYGHSRHALRLGTNFCLLAIAFAMFGFYNLFYQGYSEAATTRVIPDWLFNISKFGAPIALIIVTRLFVIATRFKSFRAYEIINSYRYYEYGLYVLSTLCLIAMIFIHDRHTLSLLIAGLFLPHSIGGAIQAFTSLRGVRFGNLMGAFFLIATLQTLLIGYLMYRQQLNIPDNVQVYSHLAFSIMTIVFAFVCIRYGYDEAMRYFEIRRLDNKNILDDLHQALKQDQFYLVFQPKVSIATHSPHSAEALVRWDHPRLGLLSPKDFIPIAEHADLIDELCKQVINKAVKQSKALEQAGSPLPIAVNLSARNLNSDIVNHLKHCLNKAELKPKQLIIEITETYFVHETEESRHALQMLNELGTPLSLDDYGTGFSSLSYIKELSLSELKIDRSYVHDITDNEDNRIITQSTISMAQSLGLKVIAEGIEQESTLTMLKDMGCDIAQGYFINLPMTASDLQIWLEQHRPSHQPETTAATA